MNWLPSNYIMSEKILKSDPLIVENFEIKPSQKRAGKVWFPVYKDQKFWDKFKTVTEAQSAIYKHRTKEVQ